MPDYVFTSRDGDVYDIQSPDELTPEQIKDIDLQLNPARASDYFRGSVSALSEFGYNVLETAHEVGNFIGGEINKAAFGESGKDIENPWDDFKEESRDVYEGDVPQHVKDRLSYKVTKGVTQLAGMAASGPAAPFTMASQGFAAGREDYLNSMGVSDSEATQDQLEAARGVGAMVAIPTVVLEKIGLGRIGRGLSTKLSDKIAAPATKRVVGMMATEGATEGLEQVASNIIASDIAGYDPSRSVGTGVGESALVGSLVGGVPGGARYSPVIAVEGIRGLKKVANVGVDAGITFAQSKAAKQIVDLAANKAIKTIDIGSDLSQKMAGALVERGINVEPLARGGQVVKHKITSAIENRGEALERAAKLLKKGADVYRETETARIIDGAIRPLNDRVKAVNERLGQELMNFEHEHVKRVHDFYQMAKPALEAMAKIEKTSKVDKKKFHKAWVNKDFDTLEEMLMQYGDPSSFQSIGKTLRLIYEESAQRGSGVGHIEKYLPRHVKDYPKLSEKLGAPLAKTQWRKILNDAEEAKGEPLNQEEEAALFEDAIRTKRASGIEPPKSKFTKQRKLDVVEDDLLEFYANPLETMMLYMHQMSDQITRLDFLGAQYDVIQAGQDDDAVYTQEEISEGGGKPAKRTRKLGAFGRAIKEELEAGRMTDEQVDKVHGLLGARFSKKAPMSGHIRTAKTLTYLAFLGSPTTAITQLGDYAYSLHNNGINETLRALKKPDWTLEDVYQIGNDISWEFSEDQKVPAKMQKMLGNVLSATGMRRMDAKAKSTFLTATYNRWKKTLNGRDSKAKSELIQKIQRSQGISQASDTIRTIKDGKKGDGVAEMLFYELSEIAPLTQSDMPEYYSKYPNGRLFYALKSYTLKQFNYARNQSLSKITSGDPAQVKEGFRNLLSLSASLALANIPADILKDFLLGDEFRLGVDDLMIDNLWRLLGLNSYTNVILKREGLGSVLENLTLSVPLVSVADSVWYDVTNANIPFVSEKSKTTQHIPVIGKIWSKWRANFFD